MNDHHRRHVQIGSRILARLSDVQDNALRDFLAAPFGSREYAQAKDRLFDLLVRPNDRSMPAVQTRINKLAKAARAAGYEIKW